MTSILERVITMLSEHMSAMMSTWPMRHLLGIQQAGPLITLNSYLQRHLTGHPFNFELSVSFNHASLYEKTDPEFCKFNGIRHANIFHSVIDAVYFFIVIFIDG